MKTEGKNREILSKAIGDLKQYNAPKDLYGKIEAGLYGSGETNVHFLKKAIRELPKEVPAKDIWSEIDKELGVETKLRISFNTRWIAAAAGILILISSSISILFLNPDGKESIEISSESANVNWINIQESEIDNSTLNEEIIRLCLLEPAMCNNTNVIELKKQLFEVVGQQEEIKMLIEKDNSPELQEFLQRIQKEKIDLEIELIKLITNS